ncbi:hypothetical protein [Runella aurantiaca]|nr:hypothetical protein [Runella aurantiaca]
MQTFFKIAPLDRQFDTIEEAAKAKTEYLVQVVLKGVDLSRLKA